MRLVSLIGLLVGLAVLVWIAHSLDLDMLSQAVAAAGWGVVLVSLFKLATLGLDTVAWAAVIPKPVRPGFLGLFRARWIGEGINTLLPVAQVGGDVARGRLLAAAGVPGAVAGASVVADFTLGVVTQALVTLLAAALLAWHGLPEGLAGPVVGGLAAIAFGGLALALVQRAGVFGRLGNLLQRSASGDRWVSLAGTLADLETALRAIYRNHKAVLVCGGWRLLGWIAHLGETWIALWILGHPVGLAEALVIETLANAVRSAAFLIPGALGAQEGGLLAVGLVYGLTPETAVALALVKRGREVAVSLPAIAAWLHAERSGLARLFGRAP